MTKVSGSVPVPQGGWVPLPTSTHGQGLGLLVPARSKSSAPGACVGLAWAAAGGPGALRGCPRSTGAGAEPGPVRAAVPMGCCWRQRWHSPGGGARSQTLEAAPGGLSHVPRRSYMTKYSHGHLFCKIHRFHIKRTLFLEDYLLSFVTLLFLNCITIRVTSVVWYTVLLKHAI